MHLRGPGPSALQTNYPSADSLTQKSLFVRLSSTWISSKMFQAIDLQKKFRVPLRGQGTERRTIVRHQSPDLLRCLSKVQQRFIHFSL